MLHPAALTVDKARFARVFDSFNMDEITPEQLQLKQTGTRQRVICLTPHALLTTEKSFRSASIRAQRPAWMWRRKSSNWRCSSGITVPAMWAWAFGQLRPAMRRGGFQHCPRLPQPHRGGHQRCRHGAGGQHGAQNKGGLAFALNGQVVGELPLPVAGLMSTESAETVEEKLQALKAALKAHGISEDIDAFMTLAFVSLPVIPKLRLNTYGIVDVDAQRIVPAVF